MRREWWFTCGKTWAVFIPSNVVSFTLIPLRHQATMNAAVGFVYAIVLSVVASRATAPARRRRFADERCRSYEKPLRPPPECGRRDRAHPSHPQEEVAA